jgi:hypothetical protein
MIRGVTLELAKIGEDVLQILFPVAVPRRSVGRATAADVDGSRCARRRATGASATRTL